MFNDQGFRCQVSGFRCQEQKCKGFRSHIETGSISFFYSHHLG